MTPVLSLGDPVSVFAAHADRMHSGNSGKTLRMLIGNFLPSCIRVDAPVRRAVYHHLRSLLCVDVANSLSQVVHAPLCPACRPIRRRESVRRASAIYRVKPRARRLQSVRQARYRDRLRGNFVDKKSSWCGPCQTEFPAYQRASAAFGRRVAFIGIDGKDHNAAAAAFLHRFPVSYPSYTDPHEKIARSIQAATYYPQTVYIDRQGHEVFDHAGPYETAASLEKDIRRYALG